MTFSLTFPRRSRLLHSGSYIPYPSRRTNSLPTWNYWWFFKSVKQASRPQSAQGFPLFPPSSILLPPLHGSRADFTLPLPLPLPNLPSSFLPQRRTEGGPHLPPDRCLAPCYLFFKLSTFHPLVPLLYSRWSSNGEEERSSAIHSERRERNFVKRN